MKVVKECEPTVRLELGDIIEWYDGFFIVMELDGKYCAKTFDGLTGLFGIYDSLEELNEAFIERGTYKDCTVYKPSEYYLAIKRKGEAGE